MEQERFAKQLAFLVEIDKMKTIFRRTRLITENRCENDAEHSWHFALTALVLLEYAKDEVDVNHVLRMALVHDLVEVYAGDTFAYDEKGYEDKEQRELAAADKIFGLLPREQGHSFAPFGTSLRRLKQKKRATRMRLTGFSRLSIIIKHRATRGARAA